MGELVIKEVLSRKELRSFIYLPEKVHKDESEWLPPIYMDEWELFSKKMRGMVAKTKPACRCLRI